MEVFYFLLGRGDVFSNNSVRKSSNWPPLEKAPPPLEEAPTLELKIVNKPPLQPYILESDPSIGRFLPSDVAYGVLLNYHNKFIPLEVIN